MTPEDVKALREKATSGPWVRDCWDILGRGTRHGGGTGHVCEVSCPNGTDDRYWNEGEADANAAFIAAAHDMADLIAEQAREIAEVTAERDKWSLYAHLYSAWVNEMAETLEDRKNDLDPDDWEDQKILGLLEKAEAGIVAAYRAAWGQK